MIVIAPIGYPVTIAAVETTVYVASLVVEFHVTASAICVMEVVDS